MAKQAVNKIESVAPRNNFRFLAVIDGGDAEIDHSAGTACGQERHFCLELKMVSGWQPGLQPRAADEPESALAVEDAATPKEHRHDPIGPATQEGYLVRLGHAIADDEIGGFAKVPEAFKIGGVMLTIAIEKEEPFDGCRQLAKRGVKRSRFPRDEAR